MFVIIKNGTGATQYAAGRGSIRSYTKDVVGVNPRGEGMGES